MDESGLCIESAQSGPPKTARIDTRLATMKWRPAGIAWHGATLLGTWQKGDRMQPHQKIQWNLGYWLLALLALTWAQSVWQTTRSVEAVPYSAFEQALTEGRVAAAYEERDYSRALREAMRLADLANQYVNDQSS